ncbi:FKBP-like peptidyl-prolyl cis-trans isomerase family protein, partial [Prunus dulcis]
FYQNFALYRLPYVHPKQRSIDRSLDMEHISKILHVFSQASTFPCLSVISKFFHSPNWQMEALSFRSLLQLPSTLRTPSYVEKEQPKNTVAKNLHERLHSSAPKILPRRLLLQFMGFSPILSHPVFAAPVPGMKEPEVIRTLKLPSGLRIQEIVEGQGSAANEGDLVEINYTLYILFICTNSLLPLYHTSVFNFPEWNMFWCSTVDQFSGESTPVILPLDEKQIIAGLKEVLVGMRIGGKRRALIPPYVGYINENLKPIPEEFGPRRSLLSHVNEPLIFEVQLLKILAEVA